MLFTETNFLLTLLHLHSVNCRSNLWWRTNIEFHSARLTLSGQLTSLTDKVLVLHMNQLPIILMVLVPQHQTTSILRKRSEVMSQSSFLILGNSIYLDFYTTLTSEIMGWDKHVFLVSGCGVKISQCKEQTLKAIMSVYKCSLCTGSSTASSNRIHV